MVILIGILGILVTVGLHAMVTTMLIATLKARVPRARKRFGKSVRAVLLSSSAGVLAFKHGVDILLWASVYWVCAGPQFAGFEDAVYFSSVTYTTLGFGDLVITGHWRLLCAFEAINGLLLFGLSTALLFVLMDYLWLRADDASQSQA